MEGGCLCGKVSYRIKGEIIGINYCHCKQCQKASGTAFATSAAVKRDNFTITGGQEYLAAYASTKDKYRHFCRNCGSPIYSERKGITTIYIRLGTLDTYPGKRPEVHIHANSKACWHKISDELPQLKQEEGLWF